MASTLDVVNECLATMGESPLNVISEPHEFKASALRILAKTDKTIQAKGWWYNREEQVLVPDPSTSQITIAGDAIRVYTGVRLQQTMASGPSKPWIVQRGRRLYDTVAGSYVMTDSVAVAIVRQIPFEDLPSVINDYIASETVLRFQSNFDGDSAKRKELEQSWTLARSDAMSENIRQLRVNLKNNNPRLARVKSVTRYLRG